MSKRMRGSDVERETMEELIDEVQSQAATIEDLKDKLQGQSATCRELIDVYASRYERLKERYRMCFTFWLRLSD